MKSVAFYTLGCKVNQYETQAMRDLFEASGYQTVDFHTMADVYVVNSCTVTGTGDKKSRQAVHRAKRQNPQAVVVLAGCYAQHLSAQEQKEIGADVLLGTGKKGEVVTLTEQAMQEKQRVALVDDLRSHRTFEETPLAHYDGKTRAILKIQDGCDRYCAYCIIPYVRGPIRSRNMDAIRQEAVRLAASGFSEIVLTGIQVAAYGKDLESGSLADVIECVAAVDGIKRIRLSSLEQPAISEDFLRRAAATKKLCPSFHLSLQSGSDSVLARMNRRYSAKEYLQTVALIRRFFPDAGLTTDVIVGFPGETEEEFLQTVALVQQVGYLHIHVFPFSPREGTKAADMPDQVPAAIKEKRVQTLLALSENLQKEFLQSQIGKTYPVLFEQQKDGCYVGFTPNYIETKVKSDMPLTGTIQNVILTKENIGLR